MVSFDVRVHAQGSSYTLIVNMFDSSSQTCHVSWLCLHLKLTRKHLDTYLISSVPLLLAHSKPTDPPPLQQDPRPTPTSARPSQQTCPTSARPSQQIYLRPSQWDMVSVGATFVHDELKQHGLRVRHKGCSAVWNPHQPYRSHLHLHTWSLSIDLSSHSENLQTNLSPWCRTLCFLLHHLNQKYFINWWTSKCANQLHIPHKLLREIVVCITWLY